MPVDTGKIKEFADISKDKVAKETEISSTINESETQSAEKPVENVVETQHKEEVAKRKHDTQATNSQSRTSSLKLHIFRTGKQD